MDNDQPASLETLNDLQSTRFVQAAILCVIFYDSVLRFPDEIAFIWKRRVSFLKLLYLWQRYFGYLTVIMLTLGAADDHGTMNVCEAWYIFLRWGAPVYILTTEVTVFLWIWALYDQARRILVLFGVILIIEIPVIVGLLGFGKQFQVSNLSTPSLNMMLCSPTNVAPNLPYAWITTMVNACLVHGMILHRRRRIWTPNLPEDTVESQNSRAIRKLCLNSMLLIIPINLADLICAAMWFGLNIRLASNQNNLIQDNANLIIYLSITLGCCNICSGRLLLDILSTYYRQIKPTLDFRSIHQHQSVSISGPVIYAEEDTRNVWAYELRQIKFSGFR